LLDLVIQGRRRNAPPTGLAGRANATQTQEETMTEALLAGRRPGAPAHPRAPIHSRASTHPRAIVATSDGVFLWPGIPLVPRHGNRIEVIDAHQLAHLIGQFYGPRAILGPILRALNDAAWHLRHGAVDQAQRAIDRAPLPSIAPNGRRLMRAIARRQGISLPNFPVADIQSGTVWRDDFVAALAKTYDDIGGTARHLAKSFDPDGAPNERADATMKAPCPCGCMGTRGTEPKPHHRSGMPADKANFNLDEPRIPRGNPGGGEWTGDGSNAPRIIPAQETIPFPEPLFPDTVRPAPSPAIPRPMPTPGDILPYDAGPSLENPYPDDLECVEEWNSALTSCLGKLARQGKRPDNRGFGNLLSQCVMGQVTERCGGNPVEEPEA
jgi:hypothetical protein